MSRHAFPLGALFCLLAVALGAFGTHGLRGQLSSESLEIYKTGTLYQFLHGIALIVAGAVRSIVPNPRLDFAAICFVAGIVVFSGSLYGLAILGVRQLGAIAPIGGALFLVGWLLLALFGWQLPSEEINKP